MAYDEFARLYGPPMGTFDADWVPGLPDADLVAAVDAAVDFCDAYDVEPPRT